MNTNYLASGILISVFTLVIFLIDDKIEVNGSSDPGQSAFLQKRAGFLSYNNTDYGFQILYPQDWTVIEGDSEPGDFVTDIVFFEPLGEKGKHFSKTHPCGEVCFGVVIDNNIIEKLSLDQYSDAVHNTLKAEKGPYKLLNYNSLFKLDGKKSFELLYEIKQGNREYIEKFIGTAYPHPDEFESKLFLDLQFKTRTKYSNEMSPLGQTMIDSFRFTKNSTQ
jgi:hypothetical protein